MSDSVHYVLIMEIQKITKVSNSVYDNNVKRNVEVEANRTKEDVARVVITDKVMPYLLGRGQRHLELIAENEVDTDDKKIGRLIA